MQGEELTAPPPRRVEPVAADANLVAALVRGQRDALGALYDRHAPMLLALSVRLLQDRGQAEELVHDVFIEAWHHARDYDPSRGTVGAWLVTRTRSRALDRRAARQRQARLADRVAHEPNHATAGAGCEPAGSALDGARLRGQLARLAPDLLAVLELAYFEGLSSSEIAERLAIPIGTVKSRMARALATLRAELDPSHGGAAGAAKDMK